MLGVLGRRYIAVAADGGGWMSDYGTIPAAFSPPNALPNGGNFTGFSRHV